MKSKSSLVALVLAMGALGCAGANAPDESAQAPYGNGSSDGEVKTGPLNLPGQGIQTLTYRELNGQVILDGDITFDLDKVKVTPEMLADRGAERGNEAARWVGGVIPFVIAPSIPSSDPRFTAISQAKAHIEATTGIRLVARTSQPDYVKFVAITGDTCSSPVGRQGGAQLIQLAPGCSMGPTVHEIGHSIGLWHEQSRVDRDNSVIINWANIRANAQYNFQTYVQQSGEGRDTGSYDFASIMHYAATAFSINGLPTIQRRDGLALNPNQSSFSAGDIRAIMRMYPRFNYAGDSMPQIASAGGPSITTWGAGRLDAFAIGTDGTLRHAFFNQNVPGSTCCWSNWENFGGPGAAPGAGVDAVSWGVNRIDAVFRGRNGSVWHWFFDNGGTGFEDLNMQTNFDPGISSWGPGNVDIFATGTDSQLKHKAFRNGWYNWENLGGVLTAGIDAVSWGVNRIDMVSRNSSSTMVHKTWDGSWSQWTARGGSIVGTPTITTRAFGHFDILGQQSDGSLGKRSYDQAWELDWGSVGGGNVGAEPDATTWSPGRIDVVSRNTSTGMIQHAFVDTAL